MRSNAGGNVGDDKSEQSKRDTYTESNFTDKKSIVSGADSDDDIDAFIDDDDSRSIVSESMAMRSKGSIGGSSHSAISMTIGNTSDSMTEGASSRSSAVTYSNRSSVRSSRSRRSSRRSKGGSKKRKGKPLDKMDEVSEASNEESELGVMRDS